LVCDAGNNLIRKILIDEKRVITVAGSGVNWGDVFRAEKLKELLFHAALYNPYSIAIDAADNIFFLRFNK